MKKELRDMLKERGRNALPAVLLVSAECAPLSKTGGLADVVGTLPKALAALGIDARVITPYHRVIKNKYHDKAEHMFYFYAQLGWRREYVGIEKLVLDGVTVYLVDNERYFGDSIYRGGNRSFCICRRSITISFFQFSAKSSDSSVLRLFCFYLRF